MRAWMLSAVILLAGCTSSYEGVRLPPSGDYKGLNPKQDVGVPFTLPKPEFTIKRVEGSDPERFDFGVANVPDTTQRYAVRIKPTLFAKIDTNFTFGAGGGLTSSSADVTDQAIPFATAVIKLAASVATVAMASPGPRASGTALCLNQKGVGALAICAIKDSYSKRPATCLPSAGTAIVERLQRAVDADKDDKGAALDTMFVRTDPEKACFVDAASEVDTAVKADVAAINTGFQTRASANNGPLDPKNIGSQENALFAKAKIYLADVVEKRDVSGARKLVYATRLAVDGKPEYLQAFLGVTAKKEDAPKFVEYGKHLQTILTALKFQTGEGSEPIVVLANGTKAQKALENVPKLTAGQWRARYVPVLQYELAEAERAELGAATPKIAQQSHDIAIQKRRDLAAMVNMSAEFARLEKIDLILDAVPGFGANDKQSRIDQYQGYVKQASDIRTEMATRLTAAVSNEKAAKKEAVLPVSLPWVSRACITQSAKMDGWVYTAGADAPDYVIVLRNALGDIVPPTPTVSSAASGEVVLPSECGS